MRGFEGLVCRVSVLGLRVLGFSVFCLVLRGLRV